MTSSALPMPASQRTVQVCLFIVAAIALLGGTLQMTLGQPETSPRLDNVHRFLAGIYLSMSFISFWTAWTIRQQGTLVYLIALGIFIAAIGRIISIAKVGLPEPASLWIGYLIPELVLPFVMALAHRASQKRSAAR